MVTQARSGPDATSVFPDSRKVLYCYVVPGSIVVDEESAQAISVPVAEGGFGGGGLVFVLIFGDRKRRWSRCRGFYPRSSRRDKVSDRSRW
ncbi:hypothetical protein CMK14_20525 [Candidatus Poribacteria bacterium]|nr:hypothetical protein [Candidatus Poribacteria bacterium]